MTLRLTLSLLFCLGLNTASYADLYYWKATDGSMMATDKEPPAGVVYRTQRDLPRTNITETPKPTTPASTTQTPIATAANSVENQAVPKQAASKSDSETVTESDLITVKLSPNAAPVEMKPATAKAAKTNTATKSETAANHSETDKTTAKKSAIDMEKVLAINSKEPTILSSTLTKTNDEASKAKNSDITADNLQPDDEAGCLKIYGLSCDKVFNWRDYGNKYCADYKNEHCSDAAWFEKRFKPLTLDKRHKNVLRNAAQNNQDIEEISNYLHSKYTGICAIEPDSAPLRCNNAAYDAKIMETFSKLSAKDQADIRHLQQVLKTSKDRSLLARSIEKLKSYFQAGATAATAL